MTPTFTLVWQTGRAGGGARQAEGSAPAYRIIPSDMRCGWMVGAVTCEHQGRGLLLGHHRPEDYTTPNGAGHNHRASTWWTRPFCPREDGRRLGQTVKLLSSSLQSPDLTSSRASSCLPVLNDGCGIRRWLPRSIGSIYLMASLALSPFLSSRIPTRVGMWQGAREISWTRRSSPSTSWSLLSPPPPFRSFLKKKKSHVRSLSQPPPPRYCKVTAVTGS